MQARDCIFRTQEGTDFRHENLGVEYPERQLVSPPRIAGDSIIGRLLEKFCVCARTRKDDALVVGLVDQQEVTTDVALSGAFPFSR